jgi:hypothetical protein
MTDAPSPADLSGLIAQEHLAMKAARTEANALWHARRWLDLRFERGDFAGVLQAMDAATREAMALVTVREMKEKKGE